MQHWRLLRSISSVHAGIFYCVQNKQKKITCEFLFLCCLVFGGVFYEGVKLWKKSMDVLFLRWYWKVCGTRYFLSMASNTEKKKGITLKIHVIFRNNTFGILFIWLLPTRLFCSNARFTKTFLKECECKFKIFINIYAIVAWLMISEYLIFSVLEVVRGINLFIIL